MNFSLVVAIEELNGRWYLLPLNSAILTFIELNTVYSYKYIKSNINNFKVILHQFQDQIKLLNHYIIFMQINFFQYL